MSDADVWKRAFERERLVRQETEQLLEDSTRKLYIKNKALERSKKILVNQQAAMLKNEKLATIGMLSAGVAHEINNPLAFVVSNLDVLSDHNQRMVEALLKINQWMQSGSMPSALQDDYKKLISDLDLDYIIEDVPGILEDTKDGLQRIKDIVDNVKRFSRTKPGERELVNINDCIRLSLKMVKGEISERCTVDLSLSRLPSINVNSSEISQVFMNLLINASHAVNEQGFIKIKTEAKLGKIIVQVSDNGCGIPEKVIGDVFNPFFTTKPPGQGTGMGLAVVHGIIKDHGGDIHVKSQVGNGSCFTIFLPQNSIA